MEDFTIIDRIQNKEYVQLKDEIESVIAKKISERVMGKKQEMLDKINGKVNESENLDENYGSKYTFYKDNKMIASCEVDKNTGIIKTGPYKGKHITDVRKNQFAHHDWAIDD